MSLATKYIERSVTVAANAAWGIFAALNRIRRNPSFVPAWSDHPLLKSYEKSKPPLGWPRETDSLCPVCIREVRGEILNGRKDISVLLNEKVGEIKAQIIEREGKILMVKDCEQHGHFEDVLAIDPAFFKRIEELFPGRDIPAHSDEKIHNHGTSTIRYGRGSILTVDLTNRCNMMCDPCFMDANQVGFVHELSFEEIKQILDNAISVKPRRQLTVQFSGGEPTLSPHFLKALQYCRKVGYISVQAATNGIEFARSAEFAKASYEAGLRIAYLQFDGIGNAANAHRRVGNLFDVKLRAIENLHAAGVRIIPVVTIVNGINNEQVGHIIRFAVDNPNKIDFVAFQPVSFTGRDETVTDERRSAQRYTLSHLAHDVKKQIGLGEPTRDWFPFSFLSSFSDLSDLIRGPHSDWGTFACGCHPNCGVGMRVMVDSKTKEVMPISAFVSNEQLARDVIQINDAARGPVLSKIGLMLAVLRNYDPFKTPRDFTIFDMLKLYEAPPGSWREEERQSTPVRDLEPKRWTYLTVGAMWFQDLFNYDFRRTEMCIIPYGTQHGEISFCAYNTGVGWRKIVEKMHMTATLTKWYEEHGRHEIFAGNKNVPLDTIQHSLIVDQTALAAKSQTDLDERGIAKNAREEHMLARAKAHEERLLLGQSEQARHDAEMAKLYRQHVLKEPVQPQLIQIAELRGDQGAIDAHAAAGRK
jgi:uncharacterized radical SAM superfamily Fe-S cluster-containing enzyme